MASQPSATARHATAADGTPLVQLTAGQYAASVAPTLGAELSSLSFDNTELLHRANDFTPDATWQGRAPLLFPAVGRQRDGAWTWTDGVKRPMPLHGFLAPPPAFTVAGLEAAADAAGATASVTCELRSAALPAAAREAYPFPFTLRITHTLSASAGLCVRHVVTAEAGAEGEGSSGPLPFAIGNHLSLRIGPSAWDAVRLVSGSVTHEHELAPGSLLSGQLRDRAAEFAAGAPLSAPGVTDGVFGFDTRDAAAAGAAGKDCALAVALGDGRTVTVRHWVDEPQAASAAGAAAPAQLPPACDVAAVRGHRFFVLWGVAPDFLCVEPWLSGPDSLNTRAGLPVLHPGQAMAWTFTVAVSGGMLAGRGA